MLKEMGIELETSVEPEGFEDLMSLDKDGFSTMWQRHSDGSIDHYPDGHVAVEFVSRPMKNLERMNKAIDILFNNLDFFINDTMGFHIHVSFDKQEDYMKIMTWDFVRNYQRDARANEGAVGSLFRVGNRYCRLYNEKKDFVEITRGALVQKSCDFRYMSVNYHAYVKEGRHTIEFRSYAMTPKAEEIKEICRWIHDYVNGYLKSYKKDKIFEEKIETEVAEPIEIIVTTPKERYTSNIEMVKWDPDKGCYEETGGCGEEEFLEEQPITITEEDD